MSASWATLLAIYFTFSLAIAFYAFKHLRKREESLLFSLLGSFLLIFLWVIPAAKILRRKIKSQKSV